MVRQVKRLRVSSVASHGLWMDSGIVPIGGVVIVLGPMAVENSIRGKAEDERYECEETGDSNEIYLENSRMELLGLKIWGSPVQPEFNNWSFNVARGTAIRRYWEMIPADTDVLVTHGPPFGVLDQVNPSTAHLGCEELAKVIEEIKPRLHLFGHIHGGHGSSASNGTQFVNASVVNEAYRLVYEPQVVEIEI